MTSAVSEFVIQALQDSVRRLEETDAYDPVKGSLFDNDEFEVWMLVVVTVLVIALGSLAAGAGIGGGGLFVPLFAFVLGVGAKAAVPMSKATILGGAMGNMMSLAFARHPDPEKKKPLIDYESSTFMQSGELLGVVFGVLLNLILPEILIIAFLAILLSFNAYKTLQKGVSKYKSETKKRERNSQSTPASTAGMGEAQKENINTTDEKSQRPELDSQAETMTPDSKEDSKEDTVVDIDTMATTAAAGQDSVLAVDDVGVNAVADNADVKADTENGDVKANAEVSEKLQKILDEDAVQFPLWAWSLLAPMTIYTVIYAIVKKDVVSTCSPVGYWLWYFSPVPVLGAMMVFTGILLKRKHKRRVEAGYQFHGDGEEHPDYREMKWTDQTLRRFPSIAILAGVAAGLLGIGGGMVIGPLFIQLDMQPKVGSSSCAFMILWTAVSGVVQYAFAGKLGWQFILYGIVVGFVSGQLGQRGVDAMLKKSGRPSYVIFLLGGIVLVACVAMTCTGTYKVIKGIGEGKDLFVFDTYDLECHN